MPVIVRDLDDDAATIIMVDSNLQRESLLPSERAFAYKMKLDAMDSEQATPSLSQAQRLKKYSQEGHLNLDMMRVIMGEEKKSDLDRVTFTSDTLRKYFPNLQRAWDRPQYKSRAGNRHDRAADRQSDLLCSRVHGVSKPRRIPR